ncbi:energy transducer TonB [Flavobacterium micromati]|uniref:energy transducer TonB n=1 Tax=Flavobacterium micromati TaxID=229205 RepID=UPI0009FC2144
MAIRFVVGRDGEIIEPKIIKSTNKIFDREAIRVITSYGKWKPGRQRGQQVRVLYTIPLTLSGRQ